MKDHVYLCCCVDLTQRRDIDGLNQMIRDAREVKYETMLSHCRGMLQWAREHQYELDRRYGLTLRQDWHVSYHKSTILGEPCFFLRWSAIEFIWVKFPRKEKGNVQLTR